MASVVAPGNGDGFTATMIPRPQIGIERLQARRASNEPKEAMNCKSCRKRKVRNAAEGCSCAFPADLVLDQVQQAQADL